MAITGKFAMFKEQIELLWTASIMVNAATWAQVFTNSGADMTARVLDNFPGSSVYRWYFSDNSEAWIAVDGTAMYDPAEPATPPL